jgi:hypothetical protein
MPDETSRRYLFVAIDRGTREVFMHIDSDMTEASSVDFLRRLKLASPTNRRRTHLKLVCWDGTGVWMCLRRLHRGQFIWPGPDEACWQGSTEQWQWLVTGVDWQRLSAPAPAQSRTAAVATMGNASAFKSGREFAAWLGLVPGQTGTGGRIRLLGISKRGDTYLRALLIHGARSVLDHTKKPSAWLQEIVKRRPKKYRDGGNRQQDSAHDLGTASARTGV